MSRVNEVGMFHSWVRFELYYAVSLFYYTYLNVAGDDSTMNKNHLVAYEKSGVGNSRYLLPNYSKQKEEGQKTV